MYRWPRPLKIQGDYYRGATSLTDMQAFFGSAPDGAEPPVTASAPVAHCYVCDCEVEFTVACLPGETSINWRESVVCPQCGLNNRLRSSVHLFESLVQPREEDVIYLTEAVTPMYDVLSMRHPGVVGSEYREGVAAGEKFKTPFGKVRNEDVTALSFYDRKFHAVLSFDVLEHVPDYRAALSEFYRVLCTGGQLLLSVPFVFDQHTRIRARLDANGEIEHLLEPVYHGDPVSHEGVLCFYEFGMDLLDDIRQAGFQESFLVCYHSKGWGYEGAQVMFVGRKRG